MGFDDIGRQQAVQVQHGQQQIQRQQPQPRYDDGYYDPYPVPNDPYAYRQPQQNQNVMMLNALLDTGLKDGTEFDEVNTMFVILNQAVKRIPNVEMLVVKAIQRKFKDVSFMIDCQGQEQRALTKMKDLLFEINSLGAYGGAPLTGISTIGAMVTQNQKIDQTVKYPTEPVQKKGFFGLR